MKSEVLFADHHPDTPTLLEFRQASHPLSYHLDTAATVEEAVAKTRQGIPDALIFNHRFPGLKYGRHLLDTQIEGGKIHELVPVKVLYTGCDDDLGDEYEPFGLTGIIVRNGPKALNLVLELVQEQLHDVQQGTGQWSRAAINARTRAARFIPTT